MTERVQLNWRVPVGPWERFQEQVYREHGEDGFYLRSELERAMRQYLDDDDDLAVAEQKLRRAMHLLGLSSSSDSASGTTDFRGTETKKVTHRINAELKEQFRGFAKELDAQSFGRLVGRAIQSYVDEDRGKRIRQKVEEILDRVESVPLDRIQYGSIPESDESGSASGTVGGTTVVPGPGSTGPGNEGAVRDARHPRVDPNLVEDVVEDLPFDETPEIIPKKEIDRSIKSVVAPDSDDLPDDVHDQFEDRVVEFYGGEEHVENEDVYITESFKKGVDYYPDHGKEECAILLRGYAVVEAIKKGDAHAPFNYQQAQKLFDDYACGGSPSRNHIYEVMRIAAGERDGIPDKPGFSFGDTTLSNQLQFKVNLHDVPMEILQAALDYTDYDDVRDALRNVSVNQRLEDFAPGSLPQQEGTADD